ncbi:MAG TPA: LysE family transporter, partial [Spirochaetota bacterium]
LLILGHAILEFILLLALLFGLAPLFGKEWFFVSVSLIGGIILIWLASGMFRSIPTLTIDWNAHNVQKGNIILTGILMSAANPYWILWWATIGVTYIMNSKQFGWAGLLFFFFGHILADLAWYTMISTAIGKGRVFFTNRIYRGFVGVCAIALVFFAILFLYRGIARIVA